MKKGVDYIGVGVGAVILSNDGRIFLDKRGKEAQNEKSTWEIPGGGVEYGESPEEAIVREMREEFGIEIEVVELLGVANHLIPEEKQHWVSPSYICRITKGEPKILEPHKVTEIGWFNLLELSDMPLSIVTKVDLNNLKRKYPEKFI